jgi:hypothetical protein
MNDDRMGPVHRRGFQFRRARLTPGIGLVFPRPCAGPIRHNSLSTRHFHRYRSGRSRQIGFVSHSRPGDIPGTVPLSVQPGQLALFSTASLEHKDAVTLLLQSTWRLSVPPRNWLCFARLSPATAKLPARAGQIGFVWRAGAQGLFRLRQGKLGSFDTMSHSDASAGVVARPRPSICGGRLASFCTPSFGVPPSGGKDQSDPRKRGTPNGPKSPRLCGRSSTRAHIDPLTTKPSKVVISYLSLFIMLPGYHIYTPIPRQDKSAPGTTNEWEMGTFYFFVGRGFQNQQSGKNIRMSPFLPPLGWGHMRR